MSNNKNPDFILLGTVIFLILSGFLILSSVSIFFAEKNLANPSFFILHQLLYGFLPGTIFFIIAYKISLTNLKKISAWLLLANIILLIMVFLPYVGVKAGGAHRWIKIANTTFQPSEAIKVTFFLYLAAWLSNRRRKQKIKNSKTKTSKKKSFQGRSGIKEDLLPFAAILGVISTLLILQPDISTLGIISLVALIMYFASGTPLWHNILIIAAGLLMLFVLIKIAPYRLERLSIYSNPNTDILGKGYQTQQSKIAIGSGGLWGRGLGMSQQKLGFLPQPITDSVFAIFAEETGFAGSTLLIAVFLIFLWRGFRAAKFSTNTFAKLLALGITAHISLQAFINIGSLIGVLPLTGVPLPFISYGGSSLAAVLTESGLLLNISRGER